MKSFLMVFIVTIVFCYEPVVAQSKAELEVKFKKMNKFDPTSDAKKDIEDAVKLATLTGKRVLLDVGGEWCSWCRRLDSLFRVDAELDEYMHENFVVVKVNFSKENENEELLSKYPKIPGYPHLFILNSKGELLHSQETGVLENGEGKPRGHDRDKILAFLQKWAPAKN